MIVDICLKFSSTDTKFRTKQDEGQVLFDSLGHNVECSFLSKKTTQRRTDSNSRISDLWQVKLVNHLSILAPARLTHTTLRIVTLYLVSEVCFID